MSLYSNIDTSEKKVMDKLINYYIEVDEYKKMLEDQQKTLKLVVEEYLRNNCISNSYVTEYVEVKCKEKKNNLTDVEIQNYIKRLIDNNLEEVLKPVKNDKLTVYLAKEKEIFEEFRKYKNPSEKKTRHIDTIRRFIIKEQKYDLLNFNRKLLNLVAYGLSEYNRVQKDLCAEVYENVYPVSLSFRRLK